MAEQIKSLKTGIKYKDTPIGKIPVDWEIKNLIDTAKDEPYSFTGGPFGSNLKESSYTDSGVRIIQLQNIGDGEFLDEYQIFTSEEKADQLKSCNVYPGDIILAKMADPVSRACIIPNFDKRYLMASDGIRLSVNEKFYDKKFILYSINSKYFRENAEKHSSGTTRLRIGLTELKHLPLAIPLFVEQKKIAKILSTVDEAIEKTDQVIEKTKEAKKGLMQRLLTRGIGHKKFKKTEIGEIPINWVISSIGEISNIRRGASPRPIGDLSYFSNIGRGWVRISDVTSSYKYLKNTSQYLSEKGISKSVKVNPGDLIMSICATIGKAIILDSEACIHDGFVLFSDLSEKIDSEFLFYVLQKNESYLVKKGQIGSQGNLNTDIVKRTLFPLPPLPEQKRITEMISTIDAEIEKEVSYRADLERIKTGLMQVLLTGRIRVNA